VALFDDGDSEAEWAAALGDTRSSRLYEDNFNYLSDVHCACARLL
jgi:hypothetical protein